MTKIVVFGVKENTLEFCDFLLSRGFCPSLVITLAHDVIDTHKISGVTRDLGRWASAHSVKCVESRSYSLLEEPQIDNIDSNYYDVGFCLGWQRLIPSDVLRIARVGVFGWHGSGFKFPHGRGRSPMNWSLRLGLQSIFHYCFQYAEGADTGKVFSCQEFSIEPSDRIADLQEKAMANIKKSTLEVLNNLSALKLQSQPGGQSLMFPKLTEADGELFQDKHFVDDAINICRSCSRPFPGAFLRQETGRKIRLWALSKCEGPEHDYERSAYVIFEGERLFLRFLDGWVVCDDFE